ncbi:hypothetical protein CLV98_107183 [Dyadobacter jejuensis]|uniref:Baseplate J-like protein n=1 Tax=Dyadobacter jejuensis TaxID=1082580 RepID=A0A316AI93_9BACT|nr:hypothetical protein [Dyadobacter jejuensis]PWJ57475.1 hypothetical protein CLV98_107183 [Dyadobacter jejuensis]
MKNCQCQSEISRDGSGQLSRFLAALDPAYAKIDDRNFNDLLLYAKNYASHIRFFTLPNDPCPQQPSWREFFRKDLTVLAASLAQFDLSQVQKDYIETRNHFESGPDIASFTALFNPILGICTQLDSWMHRSISGFALRSDIELAIDSTLRAQVMRIFVLDKSAMLINSGQDLGLEFAPHDDAIWDLDQANILINTELYSGTQLPEQLFQASLEVDSIFNACFGVMQGILEGTEEYLRYSLEKYPKHQPHMALFMAFLKLFQLAQEQLNGLTEKHLNYYYRDILHLAEKEAVSDQVNLIFELAKGEEAFALKEGTPLSAGKDALGIDQVYETNREIVVNKAQVKEIKNLYIQSYSIGNPDQDQEGSSQSIPKHLFYERPIADSQDGYGEPFEQDHGKWHPFGADAVKRPTPCGTIQTLKGANYARIGFAVATPQLRLGDGQRSIQLRIAGLSQKNLQSRHFNLQLTTDQGWIDLQNSEIKSGPMTSTYSFDNEGTFSIHLSPNAPALVPYDPAQHTDFHYPTTEPVLQVTFNLEEEGIDAELLDALAIRQRSDFFLSVNVTNHTAVVLENEQGLQPTNKAFYPFTLIPNNGSILTIDSAEMKAKRGLQNISIEPVWQDGKGVNTTQSTDTAQQLKLILDEPHFNSSSDFTLRQQIAQRSKINALNLGYYAEILEVNPEYDQIFQVYPYGVAETIIHEHQAINQLLSGFQLTYSEALQANRLLTTSQNRLLPQFKFGATTLKLDEDATQNLWNSKQKILNTSQTFQQFNTNLRASAAAKSQSMRSMQKTGIEIMRKVGYLGQNQYTGKTLQEGSLYIGIENLVPPQNLSLLFQIAEGTGMDDDKDAPSIHWSYLSNNYWLPLPGSHIISDDTFGLQTTGIVLLDIPSDATNNNTLLTTGLHWLCVSVDADSHRLPYLIGIMAQAVKATFKNQGNSDLHFQTPMPESSVTKIIDKPAEIKKVEQPFESFGAIPSEVGKAFWMRSSERIRHKDRAISAYDYEKLALQNFPTIFKVKAITHKDPNCNCRDIEWIDKALEEVDTRLPNEVEEEGGNNPTTHTTGREVLELAAAERESVKKLADLAICCGPQVAPGHVLVVPVANLKNRNAINILQPRTSRRVLLELEAFLQKKASPFVQVHARNPIYEEILVAFHVQFKEGVDKGYYLKVLNDELLEFLTPWVYSADVDVPFTGKVYASAVIHFIEKRPYVDYISNFMLFVIKCNCCNHTLLSSLDKLLRSYLLLETEPLFKPISPEEVWDFIRNQDQNIVEIAERILLNWNRYSEQEQLITIEVLKWFIAKVADLGISDPLGTMKAFPDFTLTTLAVPSEARAILVSAPQHIILLEEPLPEPCACCEPEPQAHREEKKEAIKPTKAPTRTRRTKKPTK